MITVKIGTEERLWDDGDAGWVNQQIQQQRAIERPICLRVFIKTASLDFGLASSGCAGGGASRPPNEEEREIIELWEERVLQTVDFNGDQVVAFLTQLARRL